jgi:hypothetical protein
VRNNGLARPIRRQNGNAIFGTSEVNLRASLRDPAIERRRFGYRRLFNLLQRDGKSGVNGIYRLYREEAISKRSQAGAVLWARVLQSRRRKG